MSAYMGEDALEPLKLVGDMLNLHTTLSFSEVVSAQSMLRHGIERVEERITTIEQERDEAREQRDLAIAHDTQPYPTAWAYEQVCRTDREKGEQLATLRAHFTALWEAASADVHGFEHWPTKVGLVHALEASRSEYERAMREGTE